MSERKAYVVMLLSVPVLWLLMIRITGLPAVILPPPFTVLRIFESEYANFLSHTAATLLEALLGYAIANVIAVGLAISFLYSASLQTFATPWTVVIKNIPFVAIAAILIICFGDSLLPKIIIVVLVCFHPIMSNVVKGLEEADPLLIARMQTLNATRWEVFRFVRWPSALPYYMAAHESAFTSSIIAAIVAEFFFARRGLGYLILQSSMEYRGDRLFAACIVSSLLSIGAYFLCRSIETRLTRWRR